MNNQVIVISLERTPERLQQFRIRNSKELNNFEHCLGIDGEVHWDLIRNANLVSSSAKKYWSKGAIGAGLSHLLCWRICMSRQKNLLILEDDAILAPNWRQKLNLLITNHHQDFDFILLGWNLNSALKAELLPTIDFISLFEPAFPTEGEINNVLSTNHPRQLCKLKKSFGLPGYLITPNGAKKLMEKISQLDTEETLIGRGIPKIKTLTMDTLMNNIYSDINAWVTVAPLALSINNPETSLTSSFSY